MRSMAKMVSMLALATSAALLGAGCVGSMESEEQTEASMTGDTVVPGEGEDIASSSQACGWERDYCGNGCRPWPWRQPWPRCHGHRYCC